MAEKSVRSPLTDACLPTEPAAAVGEAAPAVGGPGIRTAAAPRDFTAAVKEFLEAKGPFDSKGFKELVSSGCPVDGKLVKLLSGEQGHVGALLVLHDLGCAHLTTDNVVLPAARASHKAVLEWAKEVGIPFTAEAAAEAVRVGHVPVTIDLLEEMGCPFDPDELLKAVQARKKEPAGFCCWLRFNGYLPEDLDECCGGAGAATAAAAAAKEVARDRKGWKRNRSKYHTKAHF